MDKGSPHNGAIMKLSDAIFHHNHIHGPENITWHHLHGESFRMAWDEGHGILYCDLKIISDACEMMK
jgi:hypothetical protein